MQFTDQQERFILGGYAAFCESDTVYREFCEAFPDALNLFSEHYGEKESRVILKQSVKELDRTHPKFPDRLVPMFDALRRSYLNSQEDAFMGQSRNRLEVADEMRIRLLAYADENPERAPECIKLVIDVLKEARVETETFYKLAEERRGTVAPEELADLLGKLPLEKRDPLVKELQAGGDPEIIVGKIRKEVEALENDAGQHNGNEQNQEILSINESNGQGTEVGVIEVQRHPDSDAEGNQAGSGEELQSEDTVSETP